MIRKFAPYFVALAVTVFFINLLNKKKRLKKKIMTKAEFIKLINPFVLAFEQRTGIPSAFTRAQIALETNYGKSSLFAKYNNVGGIKAQKGQKAISMMTTEFINGTPKKMPQNFAVYDTLNDGLEAYGRILLLNRYKNADKSNPVKYAQDITKAGYSTNPNYYKVIEKIINEQKTLA